MIEFNLIHLSIFIPLFSLVALVYRRLVFKYWDIEFVIFGIIIGSIPIINILTGLAIVACFIGDLRDTLKAWSLEGKELDDFAMARVSGGWEN